MLVANLEYEEMDGLLYPKIDIAEDSMNQLGKFGKARLCYLHEKKFEYYRQLFFTGKLFDYLEDLDKKAYIRCEELQQAYLSKHDLATMDFQESWQIHTQARLWAEEIVMHDFVEE